MESVFPHLKELKELKGRRIRGGANPGGKESAKGLSGNRLHDWSKASARLEGSTVKALPNGAQWPLPRHAERCGDDGYSPSTEARH